MIWDRAGFKVFRDIFKYYTKRLKLEENNKKNGNKTKTTTKTTKNK